MCSKLHLSVFKSGCADGHWNRTGTAPDLYLTHTGTTLDPHPHWACTGPTLELHHTCIDPYQTST